MDQSAVAAGLVSDVLAHYGVKGMRWGVRRKRPSGPEKVEIATRAGRRVQTRGGGRRPASADAVRTAKIRQVARKSTTDSLSNRELQDLVTRMNLERQYETLRPKRTSEKVTSFITETLIGVGKDQARNYARESVANAIKNAK